MRSLFALFSITLSLTAFADPRADYERMQKWMYSTSSVPVPASGIVIKRDTATWTLTRGDLRFSEPILDGRVTGFVFEGEGRFTMTIPDPVERAQLHRFTGKKIASFDVPFTQLVGRFSDDTIAKSLPPPPGGSYAENAIAKGRQESWLVDFFSDVDARILAAALDPGALQIVIGMKTPDFDWLTYDYDSSRREEIQVDHWGGRLDETWVSLDRPEDREADGRPGANENQQAIALGLDVKGDLTKRSNRHSSIGTNWTDIVAAKFAVTETFMPNESGGSAIRFEMNPTAQDLVAKDADGHPLTVFRDAIGKRTARIDNRVYDDDVTVVFDKPLRKGVPQKVTFEYELDLANYAPGGGWYPMFADSLEHPYTARLELTVDKGHALRAMGKRISENENANGSRTSVWVIEKPAKMITFSTASRFEEVPVDVKGIPHIVAFGPDYQFQNTQKMHNVAADVANSLQFYQALLDDKIDADTIYVTSIAGGHGQAFDGFLHLAEYTFTSEHPGASELFRAHEVAHQWWGHKIGWNSYRDQWLSEAFAEYTAMMFVQSQVKGGEGFFDEILTSYEGVVFGDMRGGFSKFARPSLATIPNFDRARLGPIALGLRASTSDLPVGYTMQTYNKGPLVLNMLRQLLFFKTGKDDTFVKILRDFVKEYAGKAPSTDDFRHVVEQDAPADWRFFFDAWINHAELPSYTWNYKLDPFGAGYQITVNIKRSDVPPDFVAIIPLRFDYEDGTHGMIFIPNKQDEQTITTNLKKKPRAVIFAPDHSLLAKVRRG
jgi:hypothetical protein